VMLPLQAELSPLFFGSNARTVVTVDTSPLPPRAFPPRGLFPRSARERSACVDWLDGWTRRSSETYVRTCKTAYALTGTKKPDMTGTVQS